LPLSIGLLRVIEHCESSFYMKGSLYVFSNNT
jgi:hypothetical protein